MSPASIKGHYFERDPANSPSPRILSAVRLARDTTWSSASSKPVGRPNWVLDYSISDCGKARAINDSEPWLPRTPQIAHLYPPGTKYWEDSIGCKIPVESSYIIFTGGELAGLDKFCRKMPSFAHIHDPANILGELLEEMASSAANGGDSSFWQVQSLLFKVFDALQSAISLNGENPYEWIIPSTQNENAAFLEKVQKLLARHLGEKPSLAFIASKLAMSPSTLSHKYSRLAGESPMKTLAKTRISVAKGLLAKGEQMKSVASKAGFYDEFHFSKTFKSITGISPSQYLRKN